MSETEQPAPLAKPEPDDAASPRGSLWSGVMRIAYRLGRDVLSVAAGQTPPANDVEGAAQGESAAPEKSADNNWGRLGMLRSVTEQLRGAADSYVAAKLDEIEARVDAKLDHIEARLDRKLVELNAQLAEMRDRELRHRLRLLKFTLIFTVLVAALSLGYKWVSVTLLQ